VSAPPTSDKAPAVNIETELSYFNGIVEDEFGFVKTLEVLSLTPLSLK
jgi:hypothetical protein